MTGEITEKGKVRGSVVELPDPTPNRRPCLCFRRKQKGQQVSASKPGVGPAISLSTPLLSCTLTSGNSFKQVKDWGMCLTGSLVQNVSMNGGPADALLRV